MIWDGSILPSWFAKNINDLQRQDLSPEIVSGFASLKHLVRIYNLRISYPKKISLFRMMMLLVLMLVLMLMTRSA